MSAPQTGGSDLHNAVLAYSNEVFEATQRLLRAQHQLSQAILGGASMAAKSATEERPGGADHRTRDDEEGSAEDGAQGDAEAASVDVTGGGDDFVDDVSASGDDESIAGFVDEDAGDEDAGDEDAGHEDAADEDLSDEDAGGDEVAEDDLGDEDEFLDDEESAVDEEEAVPEAAQAGGPSGRGRRR